MLMAAVAVTAVVAAIYISNCETAKCWWLPCMLYWTAIKQKMNAWVLDFLIKSTCAIWFADCGSTLHQMRPKECPLSPLLLVYVCELTHTRYLELKMYKNAYIKNYVYIKTIHMLK